MSIETVVLISGLCIGVGIFMGLADIAEAIRRPKRYDIVLPEKIYVDQRVTKSEAA